MRSQSEGTPGRNPGVVNPSRGTVIIPAYNEAAVIKRTLTPLNSAALEGLIEVIVVCNGCTDDTAAIARSFPAVRVLELTQGSKPAALNAGDAAATRWPRLYLDADIQIVADAVLAVLDRLTQGDILVARPLSRYDFDAASALVRSYYRTRQRLSQHNRAMWGAGAYGLSAEAHRRFGVFPAVTGDDLYVDMLFEPHEKAVVITEPSVVTTPTDLKNLLSIKRRGHRGNAQLSTGHNRPGGRATGSGVATIAEVLRTIRGRASALDAAVYLGVACAVRWPSRGAQVWERDESSRSEGGSAQRSRN